MEIKWQQRHASDDAQLFVTLDKHSYVGGDALHVGVRLVVLRPFAVHNVLVALRCEEVVEQRAFSRVSDVQETSLVNESISVLPLALEDQVLTPGEYTFDAAFTVPHDLPPSAYRYARGNCSVSVRTYVECLLWTPSDPKCASLVTGHRLEIAAATPEQAVAHATYDETIDSYVRVLFGLITASIPCNVHLQLDRSGLLIGEDTRATLTLYTTLAKPSVKRVTLTLVEQAYFPATKKTIDTTIRAWDVPVDSLTLCQAASNESYPPSGLQGALTLRIEPESVHRAIKLPSLTLRHRLRVDVAFGSGMSCSVELRNFPIL